MKSLKAIAVCLFGCLCLFFFLQVTRRALFRANYEYVVSVSQEIKNLKQDGKLVVVDSDRQYILWPEDRNYVFTYVFRGDEYLAEIKLSENDGDSKFLGIEGQAMGGVPVSQYRIRKLEHP